jgi:hypothetical protein
MQNLHLFFNGVFSPEKLNVFTLKISPFILSFLTQFSQKHVQYGSIMHQKTFQTIRNKVGMVVEYSISPHLIPDLSKVIFHKNVKNHCHLGEKRFAYLKCKELIQKESLNSLNMGDPSDRFLHANSNLFLSRVFSPVKLNFFRHKISLFILSFPTQFSSKKCSIWINNASEDIPNNQIQSWFGRGTFNITTFNSRSVQSHFYQKCEKSLSFACSSVLHVSEPMKLN